MSCCGFDIDSLLLLCLGVVIEIIDDDDLAITRWPDDVTVEITKKLSGEFRIARSISNELGRVDHRGLPRGVAMLEHR
jgi:hypothetical protein